MAARAQQMLLSISVAVVLVTLCCSAGRGLSLSTGTKDLLSSTNVLEGDLEVPSNVIDHEGQVPASALEKDMDSFNPWARFQTHDLSSEDYDPPGPNVDLGSPSPGIGD